MALAACHQRTSLPSINPPANADNPVWSGRGQWALADRAADQRSLLATIKITALADAGRSLTAPNGNINPAPL